MYLRASDNPVSIILDGSTSTDVVHYLVVLFQTLESNRLIVYFYRLIKLGVQETARAQLAALLEAFTEDGLMEYLVKKINRIWLRRSVSELGQRQCTAQNYE